MPTYRQQGVASLGGSQTCPTCPVSYEAVECSGGATRYLNIATGFQGGTSIPLQYTYTAGDVVWIKTTSTGVISCATISGTSSTAPTYFIDEAGNVGAGPYATCVACASA